MTLSLVKTQFDIPQNTHLRIFESRDTADSPNWRVSNLSGGTTRTVPGGLNNLSDGYYNIFTKRFGSYQNNTGIIREYPESTFDTVSTTQTRSVTITGTVGADTEGISDPEPNFLEGDHSNYTCDESGGANRSYRVEWDRSDLTGTIDIVAKTVRATRTHAVAASGNNEGTEGVDWNPFTDQVLAVQEGRQIDNPLAFLYTEPADRDTDIAYNTGLTVINPYNAQAVLDPGHDQSSCLFHRPTNTYLVLSETGDTIYQIDATTQLEIDRLSIAGDMTQPEGLCMYFDNLVVWGEPDEYRVYQYTAP